jgi:hypothetical protein
MHGEKISNTYWGHHGTGSKDYQKQMETDEIKDT